MTGQPENANDDKLLKLLALKRYETPPPGFFDELHSEIMHQVAQMRSELENLEDLKWGQRLMELLELRPILVGLAGAGICLLCILAVLYSQRINVSPGISRGFVSGSESAGPIAGVTPTQPEQASQASAMAATNPVPAGGFSPLWLNIQPVSWSTQGK